MSSELPYHHTPRYRRDRASSTVAAFLGMAISSLSVALGFVVVPGAQHFNVPIEEFLLYYSILILASAATFFVVGPLVARVGPRWVLVVGGLVSALSILGMTYAPDITTFFVLAVPLGVGIAGSSLLVPTTLVTGWHIHHRRGTVLGIVSSGGSIGAIAWGFVFPPIVDQWGFYGGMIAVALGFIAFATLPGLFLAKNPPLHHAPTAAAAQPRKVGMRSALAGFGAVVTFLAIGSFLMSLEAAFQSIQPAVTASVGISPTESGYMLSFFSLCGLLAQPLLGALSDRLGARSLFVVLTLMFIFGLPLVAVAMQLGLTWLYPFLAVASLSLSVQTIILPVLAVQAVGHERFPQVYGVLLAAMYVGLAISMPGWGMMFDMSGSYVGAMYLGGVAGLVAVGFVYVAVRIGRGRHSGNSEPKPSGLETANVQPGAVDSPTPSPLI